MSTRAKLRRKVVLAVTVSRCNGQEKQLAHTLDITESSARLGGLSSKFEPGEMIEIQRGAVKGKFQVVWMGTAGSNTERQAGVRSMEPNKVIWGVDLPQDERDVQVDVVSVRNPGPARPGISVRRPAASAPVEAKVSLPSFGIDAQPTRVLITICRTLTANFEAWQTGCSAAEMEDLRQVVNQLQQRLSPPHEVELMDMLSTAMHTGGRA
jgi:hypothetical protein